MHSFHALYSKSKFTRGIKGKGKGKKRMKKRKKSKEEERKGKQRKEKGKCTLHPVVKTVPKLKVSS
jgi:hypothetical protein